MKKSKRKPSLKRSDSENFVFDENMEVVNTKMSRPDDVAIYGNINPVLINKVERVP